MFLFVIEQKTKRSCFLFFMLLLNFNFFPFQNAISTNQEFFTVEPILVESSFQDITPVEGRQKAIMEGARKAFISLLEKLSSVPDTASWNALIMNMAEPEFESFLADFAIQKEKISPSSYQATLSYRFKSKKIYSFLQEKGMPIQEPKIQAKKVLLVPILKTRIKTYLWEEENIWKIIWQNGPLSSSDIPLILPIGDLNDMQLVGVKEVERGDASALERLAQKYKASGGILVLEAALIQEGGVSEGIPLHATSIKVEFLHTLPPSMKEISFTVPEVSSVDKKIDVKQLLDLAVRKTIKILNEEWLKGRIDQTGIDTSLLIHVKISSKKEWFDIQKSLKILEQQKKIKSYKVMGLSRGKAILQIIFFGDPIQSVLLFQERGLTLKQGEDGNWHLMHHTFTSDNANLEKKSGEVNQSITGEAQKSFSSSSERNSTAFDNVVLQLF